MKRFILLTITILLALSVILCFTAVSAMAETVDKETITEVYDSIKISEGQTLSSIAKEYNTAGIYTNEDYINEIRRINNIYTDTIHSGCYLTVISFR